MVGGYQILDLGDLPPIPFDYNEKFEPFNVIVDKKLENLYGDKICNLIDNNKLNKPILLQGLTFKPNYIGDLTDFKPYIEGKCKSYFLEQVRILKRYEDSDVYLIAFKSPLSLGFIETNTTTFTQGYNVNNITITRLKINSDDKYIYSGDYRVTIYLTY